MQALAKEAAPLQLGDPGALLALAERILEQALSRGADEAEVFALETRSLSVDIERTMVEGANAGGDFGLGVRVLCHGRPGFGYAGEPKLAPKAVQAALAAASQLPREGLRFAEPRMAPRVDAPDPRLAALTPETLAERAQVIIEAAKREHGRVELSGGGIGAGAEAWALANSRGVRHEESSTSIGASASAVLKDGALSTGGHHESSRSDDLHLEAVGAMAARLAVQSRRPKPVASGAYALLMKPEAMQELLEFCCLRGMVGENLERLESPFVGKLGKIVANPELSIVDDGLLSGGLGTAARDDEGLPCRRTPLIEHGRFVRPLHDLRSAARASRGGGPDGPSAEATGSAQRADRGEGERTYLAQPRAAGRNFVLDGPSKPLAELIAETRKGLVVHDVIGAHTANTVTGEFHVNSALLFRVERGEVVGPAKSVMISGSMLPWLQALDGLSTETRDLGGYSTPASLRLPWTRVPKVTVHA